MRLSFRLVWTRWRDLDSQGEEVIILFRTLPMCIITTLTCRRTLILDRACRGLINTYRTLLYKLI